MNRSQAPLRRNYPRSVWIGLSLATIWIALATLRMWWQPILTDEWNFYLAALDWPKWGATIPHPQSYIHLTQLVLAIFGSSIGSARLVGVFSALLSVWLIPPLVNTIYPDRRDRSRLTLIAMTLTALSPLVTQNAMLLDIDNTVLIPATMLIVIAWGLLQTRSVRMRLIVLSGVLALALWVKLPTPPLVMAALFLYHLLRAEWKRALEIIAVSLLGLLLFGLTFEIYTLMSGYQWAYFAPTFARSGGFFNLRDLIARFPQGLGVFVLWLSWPLVILLLAAAWQTVRRLWRKESTPNDALLLYVAIVAMVYPLIYVPAWGYPRYQAPIVPIAMTVIAALISPYTLALSRRALAALAGLLIVLIGLNWWLLPDPLYPIYQTTFEGGLYDVATRFSAALPVVVVAAVPIGLLLTAGWWIARVKQIDRRMIGANLLAVLAIANLFSLSVVQINASYSTRYRYTYDYASYLWTVQQARALGPQAYILAIKDTLNEAGVNGEEIYPYLQADHTPTLLDMIHTRRIDALIWSTKEDARALGVTDDPAIMAQLAQCYNREMRGVFIVYRLKAGVTCR